MIKESEEEQRDTGAEVSQFIDTILAQYQPAELDTATHLLSTSDIYAAVKDINPSCKISKDDIYGAMIEAGFKYRTAPGTLGIQFKWLLRAKI